MSSDVAVVTGASRGIGAATAREFARRGLRVVVNHRDSPEAADAVVDEIASSGGQAVAVRADVTDSDEVNALVAAAIERWGRVDVAVHNAMTPFPITSFAELSWEELHSAFLVSKAVVEGMIERRRGRLVFLGTGLSRRPREGMIVLGTAKAALDSFVRYLAQELGQYQITANVVAPSTVDDTTVSERLPAEQRAALAEAAPLQRLATPEDVARTVAYFASDDAAFTTGAWAPVNGGLIMP